MENHSGIADSKDKGKKTKAKRWLVLNMLEPTKQHIEGIEDSEGLKAYLSLIYGDNIKVIFGKYVFVWDEPKAPEFERNGQLYTVDGKEVYSEQIDDVLEVIDRDGNTDGFAVFSKGQLGGLQFTGALNSAVTSSPFRNIMNIVMKEYTENDELKALGKLISGKDSTFKLKIYMIKPDGTLESCKAISTYNKEHRNVDLITSSKRYMGIYRGRLIEFRQG